MGGKGFAPKDPSERRRRNAGAELTVVVVTGEIYGPALPELPEGEEWPDATLDWWETWRKCAQASTFTDTAWSYLLDTAVLHMALWDGDYSVASELRLRVAKFGATPEDRSRLRITVGTPRPKTTRRPPTARRGRVMKSITGRDT